MKLSEKQIQALEDISKGRSAAQFDAINPNTRASLFRKGLIKKDWNNPHAIGDVEYLTLTDAGKEVAAKVLCWDCN